MKDTDDPKNVPQDSIYSFLNKHFYCEGITQ